MSMITQCPACSTTFRVTPQQLQSQQGMVRCGRCATVFDGFKALATLPEETAPQPPRFLLAESAPAPEAVPESPPVIADTSPAQVEPPVVDEAPPAIEEAPAPAVGSDIDAEVAVTNAATEDSVAAPALPTNDTNALNDVASPENLTEERRAEEQPAAEHATVAQQESADGDEPVQSEALRDTIAAEMPVAGETVAVEPPPAAPLFASPLSAPPPRRRGALWAAASLLLLLTLGAQFVYLYRGDIAASLPEVRPLLNDWCAALDCTVALPQRPKAISIEASDMQAADTANPGLIILTATLRNQAPVALGYPALDVVLTNTREHTVARRIFLPSEYLTGARESRAGMAPSAEVTIRLNIDSGDLGAAGFRLDLMAAPAS